MDGRLVKGTTMDASPNREFCHVRPAEGPPVVVYFRELKALFFVRTFEGDPTHEEVLTPDPADLRARGAVLVSLVFRDGERVVGMTVRYPPPGQYFFVTPVGARSNNVRMLVNGDALTSIEPLPALAPEGLRLRHG